MSAVADQPRPQLYLMFSDFYLRLHCEFTVGDLTSFAKEENKCLFVHLFVLIENMDQKYPFSKQCIISSYLYDYNFL